MLVAALEVEGRAIGAGIHLRIAQLDDFGAAGDGLPHGFAVFQVVAGLIDIAEFDRVAVFDRAFVGGFLSGQHLEQRGFTRAVGADHADDAARRQREGQIFDQQLVAHVLFKSVHLDHLRSKARTVGDDDLGAREFFALGLVGEVVIGVDPGLGFGLTGLLALTHPFQFAFQCFLAGFVLARLLFQPLGFLFQPA